MTHRGALQRKIAPASPCHRASCTNDGHIPSDAGLTARQVIEVSDPDELVDRLKGRGRADDTEDVIRNRMKVYRDETAPLLDFYEADVKTVDAVGSLDEVFARALRALGR